MKTKIININPKNPEVSKIEEAANIIKKGGLVAFPTETVYGLGANGLDEKAVKKIFLAKGRPQDNPLILHVSGVEAACCLVKKAPAAAKKLMKKFWPGPLTLIMKKSDLVPDVVTCGLDSVALRMPNNCIALELIKSSGCPIAAPSANISGKPSPTTAECVIEDLNGKIDMIIDGGKASIGLESTVVDLTQNPPQILRPGRITREQLERAIGRVAENRKKFIKKAKSPGTKYRHYSPNARVLVIRDDGEIKAIREKHPRKKIEVLKYSGEVGMAKNLYRDFRRCDKKGCDMIIVREVEDGGFGRAIMDRLRKAAARKRL